MADNKFKFLDNFKDYAFVSKKNKIIYKNKPLKNKELNLKLPLKNNIIEFDNSFYYLESQIYSESSTEYIIYFFKKENSKKNHKTFQAIQNEFDYSKNFYIYRFSIEKDKFDFLSRTAEDILNIPYNELIQMNLNDMISRILQDDWNEIFIEANKFVGYETERSKSFYFVHKYFTGDSYKWLRDYFTLFVNSKNQASYITGIVVDATDLKDENINIQNELDFYKSILDNNIDGAFKTDFLNKKVTINNQIASFINKSTKTEYDFQDISNHLIDFNFYDYLNKTKSNDNSSAIVKIKNEKRHIKNFLLKSSIIKIDELGNPSRMTGVLIDIDKIANNLSDTGNNLFTEEVMESLNSGVAVTDERGTIKYWSNHLAKLTGITSMDATGSKIWDMMLLLSVPEKINNAKAGQIEADLKEILRNGAESKGNYAELYEIKHSDNTIKHIELSLNTVKTEKGNKICISAKDITAWFINEKSIEKELEMYRNLIENSQEIFYYQDFNKSENDFVSSYIYELTGFTPRDFLGLSNSEVFNLVHPEDYEIYSAYHNPKRVLSELPKDSIIEYRMRNAQGEYSYIRENLKIKYDDNKKPLYIAGNMRNITQEKLLEYALNSSLTEYKKILDNHTDLVVKVDKNNNFSFVNKAYCEFFGMDESLLLGKSFLPLIYRDDRSKTKEAMSALYEEPYECYIEQRVFSKNQWRWLAWKDKAILQDGEVIEIIGVGRDITEKKRAEQRLFEIRSNMEEIINNHPLPVIISDFENQKIIKLNSKARDLTEKMNLADENSNKIRNDKYLENFVAFDDDVTQTEFTCNLNNSEIKVFATKINYNSNEAILQIFII